MGHAVTRVERLLPGFAMLDDAGLEGAANDRARGNRFQDHVFAFQVILQGFPGQFHHPDKPPGHPFLCQLGQRLFLLDGLPEQGGCLAVLIEPVLPAGGGGGHEVFDAIPKFTKLYGTKEQEKKYNELAEKCKKSFTEKFYNKRRKCLYDVIGDSKIRPNQLFAISLTYQVIEPNSEIATEMFETVTKKLLTDYGLKTLAKGEPFYKEVYEGDVLKRDMSYHQGITWPWLLGIYSDAYRNRIKAEKNAKVKNELKKQYENFRENVKQTFIKEMNENSTVGSISELYDSKKPYLAKGAFAQAWSVSEIFKIILQKG